MCLLQIPLFQRGGSIIPKKLRIRRASSLMLNDPYTLSVALDNKVEIPQLCCESVYSSILLANRARPQGTCTVMMEVPFRIDMANLCIASFHLKELL